MDLSIIGDIANIATVVGLGITIYQLVSEKRRARQMATLEAYEGLQTSSFEVFNKWLPKEISKIAEERTSDAYKELSAALARIEHFCVGLNKRIYDFDTFYEVAHGFFDEGGTLYRRMIPLLERKLENASEDYFKNIHDVWREMDKKNVSRKGGCEKG